MHVYISAVCFPTWLHLTLPILDTDGLLVVGVDLAVFSRVVVAASVVAGALLPPVVVKCVSKYLCKYTACVSIRICIRTALVHGHNILLYVYNIDYIICQL